MKAILLFLGSFFLCCLCDAQILIDDKSGDPIGNNIPQISGTKKLSLIRLSTGNQSLGFSHFVSTSVYDPSNYSVHEFSLKARPTDGLGTLISNGQFAPGVKVGYTYTKVPLFSNNGPGGYIDWGGFSVTYDIDSYTLVKKDTTYSKQVYSKEFNGLGLNLFYNGLIKSKWVIFGKIGYAYQNNQDDLTTVSANDIVFISTDPNNNVQREVVKARIGKLGTYEEFDSFPMVFSFTRVTDTDVTGTPEAAKLRLGFSAFVKNVTSKNLPRTTIGVILFLTKQDKSGVRSPVIGLSIQTKDPFDIMNADNGLQNRIGIGLTSTFSL